MIAQRLTFQAKYGRGDELVALFREYAANQAADTIVRIYTDLTGTMFTVQVEMEYPDMDAVARAEEEQRAEYGTPAFQDWFARMTDVVERGERQLWNMETIG
jgi:hypothetical protein